MTHATKKFMRYIHIAKMKFIRKFSAKIRNAVPSSQEIKRLKIKNSAKETGACVLVETGTYKGDMVERLKGDFKRIYTIEVGNELAQQAQKRFANESHITVIKGDSSKILPTLSDEIKEPAIFWLDAHCSEGDTSQGSDYTPILSELSIILIRPKNDTILIDDARLFDGVNYPTLRKLRKFIQTKNPNLSYTIQDDVIIIKKP